MYEYKTEVLYVNNSKLTGKFNENCTSELDKTINEIAKDGWELVTYSYIARVNYNTYAKSAFTITFRKKI